MADNPVKTTVTESFSRVIWEPVYEYAVVSTTATLTDPLIYKAGTLLIRDSTVPTASLPYHYKDYPTATAPHPITDSLIAGAILAEDVTLTESDKVKSVRVMIQGLVRRSEMILFGVKTSVTIYDIDYFQHFGIQILETDVNFIHDNGAVA